MSRYHPKRTGQRKKSRRLLTIQHRDLKIVNQHGARMTSVSRYAGDGLAGHRAVGAWVCHLLIGREEWRDSRRRCETTWKSGRYLPLLYKSQAAGESEYGGICCECEQGGERVYARDLHLASLCSGVVLSISPSYLVHLFHTSLYVSTYLGIYLTYVYMSCIKSKFLHDKPAHSSLEVSVDLNSIPKTIPKKTHRGAVFTTRAQQKIQVRTSV